MTFGAFFLHPELLSEASFLCLRWLFWWVPVSQKKHVSKTWIQIHFVCHHVFEWEDLGSPLYFDSRCNRSQGKRFEIFTETSATICEPHKHFSVCWWWWVPGFARHAWHICPRCFLSKGRSWPIFWCTQGSLPCAKATPDLAVILPPVEVGVVELGMSPVNRRYLEHFFSRTLHFNLVLAPWN